MSDADHFFAIEKRQKRRWELVFYLRVFDLSDNSQLGHIIDISEEGLMLISEAPIELNKDYKLALEMPVNNDKVREKITLTATSVWKSSDANPDLIDTGFRLNKPDRVAIQAIRSLIDELQF